MTANLHHDTPTLAVYDPRSQAIRSVAYHRAQSDETPQSRITRQAYNANGHLTAGWDPRQWVMDGPPSLTNVHALSGEPLLSCSADAGWKAGMLGAANELRFEWDGRQLSRQIAYDDQLRPTVITEQVDDGPPVVSERMGYGEDGAEFASRNQCGRLIRHDDPVGCLHANAYDLRGSRASESRHFTNDTSQPDWPESLIERDQKLLVDGETTTWQFDALGDLLAQTDARENQRLFAYDIAGQLLRIDLKRNGLPNAPLLSDRRYSATGQIEHETAGNGVETIRRHDAQDDRLLQLTPARSGRTFQDLAYDYDPVGNISRIQDFVPVTRYFKNQRTDAINHYRYDTLSQLVEASGRECITSADAMTAYKQAFSYDQAGNLLGLVHEGVQGYTRDMVTAPVSNRSLLKPPTGEADFINGFDANGNLRVLAPGAQAMHWDCRNQLSEVIQVIRNDESNDDELYRYDAGGQRLRKVLQRKTKAATATREVRYLPGLEIHYSGNNEAHYVISADTGNCNVRAVHWHQSPPENVANDQIRYNLGDHLGSCTLELDEAAALISQEWYYAFGETACWSARSEVEGSYKSLRYCAKERDATGLYYYGLRYYASWLQRWINPDPAGDIDGFNRYRMVRNNPLRFKDNEGLNPLDPIDYIEQGLVKENQTILFRRSADLPKKDRDEFNASSSSMIAFTEAAIIALGEDPLKDETRQKLQVIYGKRANPKYLEMAASEAKEKLEQILAGIKADVASGNRFVFVTAHPQRPFTRAFTYAQSSDTNKFIYLTPAYFQESETIKIAMQFHESTHVFGDSFDFYYLFNETSKNDPPAISEAVIQADLESAFLEPARAPNMSMLAEREQNAKDELVRLARAKYTNPEHQHWAARITVVTHNADSLTALILQFRK